MGDTDGDGRISFAEFQQAFNKMGLDDDVLLRNTFSVLDLDGDGHLSFTEFCSLVLCLFKDLLADQFDKLVAEYDVDQDGALDKDGAQRFLRQASRMLHKNSSSHSSDIIDDLLSKGDKKIRFEDLRDKLLGGEAPSAGQSPARRGR